MFLIMLGRLGGLRNRFKIGLIEPIDYKELFKWMEEISFKKYYKVLISDDKILSLLKKANIPFLEKEVFNASDKKLSSGLGMTSEFSKKYTLKFSKETHKKFIEILNNIDGKILSLGGARAKREFFHHLPKKFNKNIEFNLIDRTRKKEIIQDFYNECKNYPYLKCKYVCRDLTKFKLFKSYKKVDFIIVHGLVNYFSKEQNKSFFEDIVKLKPKALFFRLHIEYPREINILDLKYIRKNIIQTLKLISKKERDKIAKKSPISSDFLKEKGMYLLNNMVLSKIKWVDKIC